MIKIIFIINFKMFYSSSFLNFIDDSLDDILVSSKDDSDLLNVTSEDFLKINNSQTKTKSPNGNLSDSDNSPDEDFLDNDDSSDDNFLDNDDSSDDNFLDNDDSSDDNPLGSDDSIDYNILENIELLNDSLLSISNSEEEYYFWHFVATTYSLNLAESLKNSYLSMIELSQNSSDVEDLSNCSDNGLGETEEDESQDDLKDISPIDFVNLYFLIDTLKDLNDEDTEEQSEISSLLKEFLSTNKFIFTSFCYFDYDKDNLFDSLSSCCDYENLLEDIIMATRTEVLNEFDSSAILANKKDLLFSFVYSLGKKKKGFCSFIPSLFFIYDTTVSNNVLKASFSLFRYVEVYPKCFVRITSPLKFNVSATSSTDSNHQDTLVRWTFNTIFGVNPDWLETEDYGVELCSRILLSLIFFQTIKNGLVILTLQTPFALLTKDIYPVSSISKSKFSPYQDIKDDLHLDCFSLSCSYIKNRLFTPKKRLRSLPRRVRRKLAKVRLGRFYLGKIR